MNQSIDNQQHLIFLNLNTFCHFLSSQEEQVVSVNLHLKLDLLLALAPLNNTILRQEKGQEKKHLQQ